MTSTAIPQGDITFFPYDATVVVVGYLLGYFVFATIFAPRVVLTFRARALLASPLASADPLSQGPSRSQSVKFRALTQLSAAPVATLAGFPHTSEAMLALVQFTLLVFFLYHLGRGHLRGAHPRVELPLGGVVQAPSFGVATAVTTNLVGLWLVHRDTLFVHPAVYALFQTTQRALHLLRRGSSLAVLPRLLAVVRASKGIQSV